MDGMMKVRFATMGEANMTKKFFISHSGDKQDAYSVTLFVDWTIFISGILANIFTLAVVLRERFRLTAFGVHLAWLSVADISVLVTYACLVMDDPTQVSCEVLNFFNLLTMLLSSWSLVILAAERALAVYFPYKIRIWCSAAKAMVFQIILLVIIAVVCIGVPLTSHVKKIGDRAICYLYNESPAFQSQLVYNVLLYSIIPFFLLFVLNCFVVAGLRRSKRFRQTSSAVSPSTNTGMTRTTLMLMVTSLVFVLTTLPISIMVTVIIVSCHTIPGECEQILDDLEVASDYLFRMQYFNHAINFFVYLVSGAGFREEVLCILRCAKDRKVSTPKRGPKVMLHTIATGEGH